MEGINHRRVEVNGIGMHIAEKGEGGPVVLMLHGFPELWYSWRHQIIGLAAKGYHAVAPDLRGFGDTDAPSAISSYSIFHLVGDIVALINVLGQEQVVRRLIKILPFFHFSLFLGNKDCVFIFLLARCLLSGMTGALWWRGTCACSGRTRSKLW